MRDINKKKNLDHDANHEIKHAQFTWKPILYVILCSIFSAAGQIVWKIATRNITDLHSIFTNLPLLLGFICYGIGAILFIMALKYGNLSIIYPFIALSFIWVDIASISIFNESISFINWIGMVIILIGVSLIGYGSSK